MKVGGIQEVVWNAGCSGCVMEVLLQEVICSKWHSLKAGWWEYRMLIVLVGRDEEGSCRVCRFWGDHRKAMYVSGAHEDLYGLDDFSSETYLVGAVKEIKSG